jgi:hypothetical protein
MSPPVRLLEILETGFLGNPVGWPFLSNLALGLLLFLTAWASFAKYAESVAEGREEEEREDLHLPKNPHRQYVETHHAPPPRAWKNALAWKDFYFLSGGTLNLMLRVLGYAGLWLIVGTLLLQGGGNAPASSPGAGWVVTWVVMIECALAASAIFRNELRDKTWSSLALLPEPLGRVVCGKVLGALAGLTPALASLVLGIIFLQAWREDPGLPVRPLEVFMGPLANLGLIVAVAYGIAFLSLWLKRGAMAVGLLLAIVWVLAWEPFGVPGERLAGVASLIQVVLYLGLVLFLHRRILRRAEFLAGEG